MSPSSFFFFSLSGNISTIYSITKPRNHNSNLDFNVSLSLYIETKSFQRGLNIFLTLFFLFPLWSFQPSLSVTSPWYKRLFACRIESKFLNIVLKAFMTDRSPHPAAVPPRLPGPGMQAGSLLPRGQGLSPWGRGPYVSDHWELRGGAQPEWPSSVCFSPPPGGYADGAQILLPL